MICRQCGTDIAEKALICYRCGTATSAPRVTRPSEGSLFDRPRRARLPTLLVVIAILVAIVVVWLFVLGG